MCFLRVESSWSGTQALESPAMCFHGNRPGMSTATQQRNVAFGEIVACRTQNSQEMISSLVGAKAIR